MRLLTYLIGRDPEDAKKLFDEAHADLIDILNNPGTKFNGHKHLAHPADNDQTIAVNGHMHSDSGKLLGRKSEH